MSPFGKAVERILLVRLGAMGDVIHAIPAQQSLRRRFPEAEIHWLAEPPYRELLEAVPGLDRVWTADTKGWRHRPWRWSDPLRLVRRLRQQDFDVAVDFQGLLKSALLARASGPGEVVGFQAERFKEKAASWLYSRTADGEADLSRHVARTNLHLTRLLTGEEEGRCKLAPIPLNLPASAEEYADEQLRKVDAQRPVLLNPGAGWVTKLWPARQYARLGEAIEKRLGTSVVYTWGPGEEDLIRQVQDESDSPIRAFPTTIVQLAALCRRARLMVAGDTGPLHLADALGIPVVAVMGPTTASRNGPFSPRDSVVQNRLHCSDCYKRTCKVYFCMNIPWWEVMRAVVKRLGQAAESEEGAEP